MAEIINNQKKINGNKRINIKSTRVDLTPMVDLGFLLITFFVFTTSMMEPKVLDMMEPNDTRPINDNLCESCALTIILADSNVVYYYFGNETATNIKRTDFSKNGIRKILREKRATVFAARQRNEFSIIIKPTELCRLQNLVNLQDEATLAGVIRYYIEDPTKEDLVAVANSGLSLQYD